MRSALAAVLALGLVAFPQDQDPVRLPTPPVGKEPLPPVPEPTSVRLERAELGRAWLPESPLEGFWRATAWTVGGRERRDGFRVFLAAGRAHLSLQVLEAVPDGGAPLFQAGARSYRLEDGVLVTTSLVGFDNYGDRKLHLEPLGFIERRGVQFVGGRLRIQKGPADWLEFERIE
jgi:hypothetical protein